MTASVVYSLSDIGHSVAASVIDSLSKMGRCDSK